jgi:resuscitation-promoting factor RpfB
MTSLQRPFAAAFGLLFLVGLLTIALLTARQRVQIRVDGRVYAADVQAATVADALAEAGIWLDPADRVSPPLDAAPQSGTPIVVTRAPVIGVAANGQTTVVRAPDPDPLAILQALGLSLGPGDVLLANGEEPAATAAPASMLRLLTLQRAQPIELVDGANPPQALRTAERTVGEALWALGVSLYVGDVVDPPLDTTITPALVITVQRSRPVLVQADGQALPARTQAATVGEVLGQVGVALVGEDYAVPAEDQPLPPDGLITVVRVREEILTDQQLIPFDTDYQALADVELDNVYQVQAGLPGVLRRLTRVRYENGVEVARVVEGEAQVSVPVPQVIGYGTQIVIRTLATPDGPIEYWRAYTMYATSYAAKFTNRTPGTPSYGRTASGKILTKGLVAIDRNMMPFGTRMYVPGYGFAEAADTGGGVRGRFIDLGFDDFNYESWSKVVTVYFLTPAPAPEAIRYIIPSTVP